jgi:hypothetical protein
MNDGIFTNERVSFSEDFDQLEGLFERMRGHDKTEGKDEYHN